MWPFGPRLVNVDGKTMTRKAQRAAEKIRLTEAKKLSTLRVERRELDLKKELDTYTEDVTARAQGKKRSRWTTRWTKISEAIAAAGTALANNLPLTSALAAVGLCSVVEIAGQFMFYGNLTWPAGWPWLAMVLPFVLPSISWHYALSAQRRAAQTPPRPHAAKTRRMWLATAIAATMNGYNGIAILQNVDTGLLLGLVSIAGPAVWHAVVIDTKDRAAGLDVTQIITTLANRLHHPVLSWRANELWSASKGRLSQETAWFMVYRQAKGHFPGQQPTIQIATQRNHWLFRVLFGRITNPAIIVTTSAPRQRAEQSPPAASVGADETAAEAADQRADDGIELPPYRGADAPNRVLVSALATSAPDLDVSDFEADFSAWQTELAQRADRAQISVDSSSSTAESASSSAHADTADSDRADVEVQRADRDRQPRRPSGSQRRRSARAARRAGDTKTDYTKAVTDYFNQRLESGDKPESVTGREAADATGAAVSTARNILSDLKRGLLK